MKNIAKRSVLMAFAAMISAQTSAEVTMEKITKEEDFAPGQPESRQWVPDFSKKSSDGNFLTEINDFRWYNGDNIVFVFYKSPNGDAKLAESNPFITHLPPLIKGEYKKRMTSYELLKSQSFFKEQIAREELGTQGFYRINLSENRSVIKQLILRVAYELHLGYQEAKAGLSDPEGNIDLKRISKN